MRPDHLRESRPEIYPKDDHCLGVANLIPVDLDPTDLTSLMIPTKYVIGVR